MKGWAGEQKSFNMIENLNICSKNLIEGGEGGYYPRQEGFRKSLNRIEPGWGGRVQKMF